MFKANDPFLFYSRLHLIELTGIKIITIPELLENLRTVSGSCIYHHTHHFIQQHQYLSPEPSQERAFFAAGRCMLQKAAVATCKKTAFRTHENFRRSY